MVRLVNNLMPINRDSIASTPSFASFAFGDSFCCNLGILLLSAVGFQSKSSNRRSAMSTEYLVAEKEYQPPRYDHLQKKLSSMKKSWSTDSLASLSGGNKTCVCAPTKHVGSFRCRHHRHSSSVSLSQGQPPAPPKSSSTEDGETK
ncbi:hypothetical protein Cni_G23490 [Canna indica]|uniref:Uncharacterized protein n=1 Tax=Canna indica TaxID=4628 RepID=A0AAQ3KU04_9LILI|nr:hypothetical protein Cni_G23490 [Canna indica]